MSLARKTELTAAFTKKPNLPGLSIKGFGKQDMQFPGQGNLFPPDATIEEIRSFIKNQKRAKGFRFTVPVGSSTFPIDISGEAKLLLGLALISIDNLGDPAAQPEIFSLLVNNEVIINQVTPAMLSQEFMTEEYYLFLRPLSGQDDITIAWQNTPGQQRMALIMYYL